MFTLGSLSLDVCGSMEVHSDFVVLPFRCSRGSWEPSCLPLPVEFQNTQSALASGNCEIAEVVQSQGCTYFIIKSDHAEDFSDSSRTALNASVNTIAQHPGKVFSTGLLFSCVPSFYGANRLFLATLLTALRDRERCVLVAEDEAPSACKVLQAVVAELTSAPSSQSSKPRTLLPPPPFSLSPTHSQDLCKRPRDECPSPTSRNSIAGFLKCPKLSNSEVHTQKRNLVMLQEEDIMCIVCFDITPDVLTSACCGVLVCINCVFNVSSCPSCRQQTSFVENLMVKKIVNNITVTCDCGRAMSWSELKAHKEHCDPRPRCPVPECAGIVFTPGTLREHVRSAHRREVLAILLRVMKM